MLFDRVESGTHVIVVRDGAVSDTTIAYHGTVVRELARSIFTHPHRADRWYYRVHVPVLDGEIDVPAIALIRTATIDQIETADDPICRIQFDAPPPADTAHIFGAYRVRGRDWVHFHFRKHGQCFDTFQLNLPTESAKIRTRCLIYNVRRDGELNVEFVQRAIGRIAGFNAPPAEDAM